jgi:hypothetical protein
MSDFLTAVFAIGFFAMAALIVQHFADEYGTVATVTFLAAFLAYRQGWI